jgi:integrase/recombinase XerD
VIADQVAEYLAAKQRLMRKGELSPATISQAQFALGVFMPWADEAGIHEPEQVTAEAMERFEDYLRAKPKRNSKPLSKETIRTYIRAARQFLKWAKAPMGDYKPPQKPSRRLLEVLSRQEIETLEKAALDERDRLIVRVLADTGIRVSELLGLRSTDLRENTHDRRYSMRVIGKGDKEREVPVPPLTFKRLKHYAEHGGPKDCEFIFCGKRRRHNGQVEPLTQSGVDQLVRNLATRAGMRHVYPHLLRHSYATHMLSKNMNPVLLQKILGHSSLAMISQTYSHLVISDTYDAMIDALKA